MEKWIKIRTLDLIALSFIIDEFDEFCDDLEKLTNSGLDMMYINRSLERLRLNQKGFIDKRIKDFYRKFSKQIFYINNHIPFSEFLDCNFDLVTGQPTPDSKEMHDYLLKHRDENYKVLDILFKLDKLGVDQIMFNEYFDFTKQIYNLNRDFLRNVKVYYIENAEPLPTYDKNFIKYKTTDSCYELQILPSHDNNYTNSTVIKTNSLLFDVSRLPSNISKHVIFDELIEKSLEVEDESQSIRESVDLNIGLIDMEMAIHSLMKTADSLRYYDDRSKVISALTKIRDGLDELQIVTLEYDNKIVKNNEGINHNVLEEEKDAVLLKKKRTDNIIKNN